MVRFFKPQTKNKIETKHQTYIISKLDHQGDGIAFVDKKPIFIPNALPDEKVLAQLTESKKNYARAKLIKVLEASPERVKPFCSYYQDCGGCNLQHLNHEAQIAQKEQNLLELMTKFTGKKPVDLSPAIVSDPIHYRRRARISAMLTKDGELELGFRRRASKRIINITSCPVLNKNLNTILENLHPLFAKFKNKACLGHIELSAGEKTNVLFVRLIKKIHKQDLALLNDFALAHNLSLFIKQNDEKTEQLQGEQPHYMLEELRLDYQPQNFLQINEVINKKMVSQAINWLELNKNDQVLDLFCGIGNFSLALAKEAKSVVGIEGVESMVEQAKQNAQLNSIDNINFYHANLGLDISKTEWGKLKYEKILLDPARAGAFEIMSHLSKSKAEKILYVSCDPATLARDSQVLLNKGYRLAKLGLLDMFSHTGHLESMALFVKS